MNNIEYLEELINIKSSRLQKFEALVMKGFIIVNKEYGYEAEVSDYYLKLKSGEEEINIPHPSLEFDKGTVIVPFRGNTYHVGVDLEEVEGEHLGVYELFRYLQFVKFEKKFIFNGDEYVKGNTYVRLQNKSRTFNILSEDVLLKVPLRNLILTNTGLIAKVVNTCIKIV